MMSINGSLEDLIDALRRHAQLMSTPDSAGNDGVAAFLELRKAAAAYGRSIREETGWDSPFADIEEDEEGEDAELLLMDEGDIQEILGAESGEHRFTVSGTWTFEVTDPEAWLAHARHLLAGAPQGVRQLSGDPAEAAAAVLAHGDIFAVLADHGLRSAGQDWTVQGAETDSED